MPNGTWLADTRAVEKDMGVDHNELACHASLLTPYIRDRLARAARALEELYGQLPSPLAPEGEQRGYWEGGREAYVGRICEVIQHLGSALSAVGCTDDEAERYLVCEETVNEAKRDNASSDDDACESCAVEEETDRETTVFAASLVEVRTEVPEPTN